MTAIQARELYRERSPCAHTEDMRTPMALFHGHLDKLVLPEQVEAMHEDAIVCKVPVRPREGMRQQPPYDFLCDAFPHAPAADAALC